MVSMRCWSENGVRVMASTNTGRSSLGRVPIGSWRMLPWSISLQPGNLGGSPRRVFLKNNVLSLSHNFCRSSKNGGVLKPRFVEGETINGIPPHYRPGTCLDLSFGAKKRARQQRTAKNLIEVSALASDFFRSFKFTQLSRKIMYDMYTVYMCTPLHMSVISCSKKLGSYFPSYSKSWHHSIKCPTIHLPCWQNAFWKTLWVHYHTQ